MPLGTHCLQFSCLRRSFSLGDVVFPCDTRVLFSGRETPERALLLVSSQGAWDFSLSPYRYCHHVIKVVSAKLFHSEARLKKKSSPKEMFIYFRERGMEWGGREKLM